MTGSFARYKYRIQTGVLYSLVSVTVFAIVAPFVWLFYSSLKTNKEFMASVWKLPEVMQWGNFAQAWGNGSLGLYAANSLVVTLSSVVITVLVATSAGFSMGIYRRLRWIGGFRLFLVLTMTIPAYVSLVPLVEILRAVGLLDTRLGLILPTIAFNVPMSIFIMWSFFVTLPMEFIEAARFDGANEFKIFTVIGLPLAKPAMFTTAIINLIWVWNEFLFALVFINDPGLKTLPVGLNDYVGEHVTNYPVMMSAVLLASLGALAIYIIFQKQVVGGLMGGGIKE